ncbi:MAG: hypothetical protein AABZ60_12765 [Planctomycetota bacterium]
MLSWGNEISPYKKLLEPYSELLRSRVNRHLEDIDGVKKQIFSIRGLYQNTPCQIGHAEIKMEMIPEPLHSIDFTYPLKKYQFQKLTKKLPEVFLTRNSTRFFLPDRQWPNIPDNFCYNGNERDFLMNWRSFFLGQRDIFGDGLGPLKEFKGFSEIVGELFHEMDNIFANDIVPSLLTLVLDVRSITWRFSAPEKYIQLTFKILNNYKVSSILHLLERSQT